MTPTLVIIQDVPTQFDEPLYERIAREGQIKLVVRYSATMDGNARVDPETGRAPQWDHLPPRGFDGRPLRPDETAHPARLARQLAAMKPGLVLLCGYYPPLHARLAIHLKRLGVRIGLRSDNTLPHSSFKGLRGIAKLIVLPHLLAMYDTWHPVGSLAEQYLKHIARRERPVFRFPYCVDNEWFIQRSDAVRADRSAARRRYGLRDEDFVILGVCKWAEREDPMTLVDAFVELTGRVENARLVLVGDGPLAADIDRRLKDVEDRVVRPGLVPYSALPMLYAIADVFVHPAKHEPWGVSVQESLACGTSVIASHGVGSMVDLPQAAACRAFRTADVSELVAQVTEVAQSPPSPSSVRTSMPTSWSYGVTINGFSTAVSM